MSEAKLYRIDVHHHLCPPDYLAAVSRHQPMVPIIAGWSLQKSLDDMGQAGVETAVLSITTPGFWFGDAGETRRLVRLCNDYAARLVSDHPAASASSWRCRSPTSRAASTKSNTRSTPSRPTASASIPITKVIPPSRRCSPNWTGANAWSTRIPSARNAARTCAGCQRGVDRIRHRSDAHHREPALQRCCRALRQHQIHLLSYRRHDAVPDRTVRQAGSHPSRKGATPAWPAPRTCPVPL